MRARVLIAALLFGAALCRAQEPGVERTLTLFQAVQTALQNNQRLLSAEQSIRIAKQRVAESRSQYFPKLGLHFNTSRYRAEQAFVVSPEFGSTLLRPSPGLEPDTYYSARLWLKQSLYNGGRTRGNIRLAETNLEQAKIQHDEIRAQVVFDAARSFYDLLLVRRQAELCEKTSREVESLAAQVPSGDAVQLAGMGALQARLRRALADRRRQEEKAYLEFVDTLGLELYTRVGIEGALEPKRVDLDLAKLLAWAQESRLELRGTEFQKEIDQLAVHLLEAERFPVVALGAGYEKNDRAFPLHNDQWNATLNVSVPLFDGFSSRARIRQKRIQANQSRIHRTEIEDRINREVREGFADLLYWQAETEQRRKELDRMENISDRLGGKSILDKAQAKEWVLDAHEAYWESVYGQRVALAKLEKTIARPLGQ